MHVTSHSEITIKQGWTDTSQLKGRLSVRDLLFNVKHFVGPSWTKQNPKIGHMKYLLEEFYPLGDWDGRAVKGVKFTIRLAQD